MQTGNTNGIAITPLDTSVISGGAVTLHATTIDHYGNPTSQPVQLSVTGPATIAGQTVTSTGIGQINVVATSGTSRIPVSMAVGNLKWAPSGTSLVFDQSANGCDLQGHLAWIYFTSNTGSSAVLWRCIRMAPAVTRSSRRIQGSTCIPLHRRTARNSCTLRWVAHPTCARFC